ncbi:hypothetical protein F9222_25560 [Escherichia coli]|nr:hypothetical protein F9222_25560 [Escherichia coli]
MSITYMQTTLDITAFNTFVRQLKIMINDETESSHDDSAIYFVNTCRKIQQYVFNNGTYEIHFVFPKTLKVFRCNKKIQETILFESKKLESFYRIITDNANWRLLLEWHEWADQGSEHEKRKEAVVRLTQCINKKENHLDLSNLNLNSLPGNYPYNLIHLNIQKNNLTKLPETLSDNIINLYANENKLSRLPQHLPSALMLMNVSNNPLTLSQKEKDSLQERLTVFSY